MMDTSKFQRYFKSTETFTYYNANPAGAKKKGWQWDRADCAIRALAKASGRGWLEAFDYLTAKARRDFNVVNDGTAFRAWLTEDGARWTFCKAERGRVRMTAEEFAKTHRAGSYVIYIANHFTACVDGVIYDTWNCGEKAVVGYFDMAGFGM